MSVRLMMMWTLFLVFASTVSAQTVVTGPLKNSNPLDKTRLLRKEVSTLRGYPHQDDYIFASGTFETNHFDVLQDTELSDHCPVVADLSERLAG
jgi:hypothetical protein